MTRNGTRKMCLGAALFAAPMALGQTIDGLNIPSDFASGTLLATQRYQTGFGDDTDAGQFGGGSELDQMFAANDGTHLRIGITGNLQNNGNALVIFIDSNGPAQGASTLFTRDFLGDPALGLRDSAAPTGQIFGRPRYLAGRPDFCPGLDNITFDAGFAPDFVLGFSGGSPRGSQTRTYYLVNWTTLDSAPGGLNHTNQVAGMMTAGDPTASGASGTLGSFLQTANLGILGAMDNSNDVGVEGGNGVSTLANTATKGVEFSIPLSLLGVGPGDTVCLFAIVTGDNGFQSNQMLPTDETLPSLGNIACAPTNWGDYAGNQHACYTLTGAGCALPGATGNFCTADLDGDCEVGLGDLAALLGAFGSLLGDANFNAQADYNHNNAIGIEDLSVLLAQFGDVCHV